MSSLREDLDIPAEAAAPGTVVVATDGRVVRADARACAVLGVDAATLVGERLADRLTLDGPPGEQRYVRPDGAVAWLLADARDGDDGARVVHLRDVTATHDRAAIDGSWVIDEWGLTVAVSPSAAALLGRRPDDLVLRSPLDFIVEEDRPLVRAAFERRRDGRSESYELRWLHRDGSTVRSLLSAAPIRDHDGRYVGAFGLVSASAGPRPAEERLARQARRQEAVARLSRRALGGADRESLFDDASRTCAEVLGTDFGGVLLLEGDRMRVVSVHGLPAGAARDLQITRADAMPPVERLATAEPVTIRDFEAEADLRRPEFAVTLGIRSAHAHPIAGRALHGVVAVAHGEPWAPDADEARFLEAVANMLAAALDREEAEDAGRHRALHDPLTGLPNRTLALDRLDQALRRDVASVAVIAIDLDRFKRVNDTFGVAAADDVLRTAADRLRRLVPPADTVARLGGDTFLVVCEEISETAAGALAGRVVERLRLSAGGGDDGIAVTVSVGLALAGPGQAAGDVLRDAEAAVERAKGYGRDRFELFDPQLRASAADRVQLERDLRHAIERDELFVAHQPIVSVGAGQITGTEALVRWRHPQRGVVPPGDFIAIAEETGVIAEIGAWVLRRACADVAAHHRAGRRLTCHVNLSPRQAADPELPGFVASVLEETGLPAEALVLELTESSVMEAGDEPLCVMQSLRALGVRVVLDDFGTGYSSLARLRAFPIDGLKVDRSFVSGLDGEDPADALIVSGIVELARALGLTVVAEGVETAVQLERLRRVGCRYAQGFLLARPAEVGELDRLLAREHLLPAAA